MFLSASQLPVEQQLSLVLQRQAILIKIDGKSHPQNTPPMSNHGHICPTSHPSQPTSQGCTHENGLILEIYSLTLGKKAGNYKNTGTHGLPILHHVAINNQLVATKETADRSHFWGPLFKDVSICFLEIKHVTPQHWFSLLITLLRWTMWGKHRGIPGQRSAVVQLKFLQMDFPS